MNNTWDKTRTFDELCMPFMPTDGYVSYQNPPDFTWPWIKEAESYDIVVASDKELNDIKYSRYGLKVNFFNFDCIFTTGKYFFWAVRYYKDGIPTEWSSPRSFRIHPSADEFPVPPIDELLSRIGNTHPKICVTADKLAEFRALKDKNDDAKRVYDTFIGKADEILADGKIDGEPECQTDPNPVINQMYKMKLFHAAEDILAKMFKLAFSYLLTGDKKYADMAVRQLLEIASWDMEGVTSYENQDQVHRAIAYRCAIAFDWLCDAMNDEQRGTVIEMIRARTKVMEHLLSWLKDCPFDSHGWTAFGYIGIISIACFSEIPESADWLRQVIPQYTVLLPPWSYQDGGWSQGTDYWQYSTSSNKIFMEILSCAGIIDLYKKTWAKNEYLWSLYVYPYGMHGSFGDDSGLKRSELIYSGATLYRDAAYIGNGVAKWLAEQYGELIPNDFCNYNVSKMADVESAAPTNYPLSHHFRDIGWITMANDIMTPERIMMAFKSSEYGSFNHSHCDQNSFFIEAFGENLAVKSGYYDSYHSAHDSGFTRKSPAHNTVTLSKSRGQRDDKITARGSITAFLNGSEYDLAAGDATPAYFGELGKFTRHIVYVRPDVFIAVDDLKTNGKPEKFEWWLNAEHNIEITERGAVIREGSAVLDATVVYPRVRAERIDTFSSSDGIIYPADGRYKDAEVHKRVYFETDAVSETKMVVAMGVHKDGKPEKRIASENCGTYIKLTVEDETVIYVNLGEPDTKVITADGVEFAGALAVAGRSSAMLASGTLLSRNGNTVIAFNAPASAVVGCGEIGIFTDCDNAVTVGTENEYLEAIARVTDRDGLPADAAIGVDSLIHTENTVTLIIRKGEYSLVVG